MWLWSEGGNGTVAEGLEVRGWGEVAFEGLFSNLLSTSTRCLVDIQVWRPEDGSELQD